MDIENPKSSLSNEEMEKIVAEIQEEEVASKPAEPEIIKEPEVVVAEPPVETPKEEVVMEEEISERPIKAIPIYKYTSEKKEWRKQEEEYKKTIEDLTNKIGTNPPANRDDIKSLADKYAVDENLVNDLVGLVSSKTKTDIPQDLKDKLDFVSSLYDEKKQETGFEKEFSALEKDYPEVKDNKDQLKELAFTDGYQNKSLFEIYFRSVKKDIPIKKKSAEPSRGGSQASVKSIDFSTVTEEDIEKMGSKEFEEYQNYLSSKSDSSMKVIR